MSCRLSISLWKGWQLGDECGNTEICRFDWRDISIHKAHTASVSDASGGAIAVNWASSDVVSSTLSSVCNPALTDSDS